MKKFDKGKLKIGIRCNYYRCFGEKMYVNDFAKYTPGVERPSTDVTQLCQQKKTYIIASFII